MDAIIGIITSIWEFLSSNSIAPILGAVTSLLSALIAVCLLIPGEQPEKFLQGILDFLAKFSVKK